MKIKKGVEIDLTPEELAAAFASAMSDEQARFFSALAREAGEWQPPGAWVMQLQAVTDREELTVEGRAIMQAIGEYSHAPGIY